MSASKLLGCAVILAVLAACAETSTSGPDDARLGVNGNSDNAAWVDRDAGLCGMPGSNAAGGITFGGIGTVTHVLENNNKATITCKGEGITNLSGKAQQFRGFICGVQAIRSGGGAFTNDSHATVAPNGNATLTCTVDKTP